MKKTLLALLVVAGLASCSSPTKIVNSWRDPETTIKNPRIHKIVVAALIVDPGVRRQVEDYMASLYPGTATQSYEIFGQEPLGNNEEQYNQMLKNQGYDGIVIMRQTNENTSQHYVPGMAPEYYNTWGSYWHHGWGGGWHSGMYMPGTQGHVETDRTWTVQVTAFSLLANKMIWSGDTKTTNPGGHVPLFEDVCKAVRKQMKTDGLLN